MNFYNRPKLFLLDFLYWLFTCTRFGLNGKTIFHKDQEFLDDWCKGSYVHAIVDHLRHVHVTRRAKKGVTIRFLHTFRDNLKLYPKLEKIRQRMPRVSGKYTLVSNPEKKNTLILRDSKGNTYCLPESLNVYTVQSTRPRKLWRKLFRVDWVKPVELVIELYWVDESPHKDVGNILDTINQKLNSRVVYQRSLSERHWTPVFVLGLSPYLKEYVMQTSCSSYGNALSGLHLNYTPDRVYPTVSKRFSTKDLLESAVTEPPPIMDLKPKSK